MSRSLLLRLTSGHTLAPAFRILGRGLLSVFMLHRFTDRELGVTGTDPAVLRDHLAYLRRHNYELLSLQALFDRLDANGGRPAKGPAVAFTVDDGYIDFVRRAVPVFAEFDCPVTLFVTTGFLDGQLWLWWDRLSYMFARTARTAVRLALRDGSYDHRWSSAAERARAEHEIIQRLEWVDAPERETAIADLGIQLEVDVPVAPPPAFAPVSWTDVRRIADGGVTFGPHGVTHRILSQAPADACAWEIAESHRRLCQESNAVVPVFCYPNGSRRSFGEREVLAVTRAGLRGAVTAQQGYATAAQRFELPRFPYPDDRPHLVNVVAGLSRLGSLGAPLLGGHEPRDGLQ